MLTILFIVLVVMVIVVRFFEVSVIEPPFVMLGSWLLMVGVLMLNLIDYGPLLLNGYSLFVAIGSITAFVFGAVFVKHLMPNPLRKANLPVRSGQIPNNVDKIIWVCCAVYIVGLGLELLNSPAKMKMLLSVELTTLRTSMWQDAINYDHSFASLLKAITRPVVILTIIMSPLYWLRPQGGMQRMRGVVILGVMVLESALVAGRSLIALSIFGLLVTCCTLYYIADARKFYIERIVKFILSRRGVAISVVVFTFTYFFFAVFPALRNPQIEGNVDKYLGFTHGDSNVASWVYEVEENFNIPNFVILAYGSRYLGGPLMRLTYFLEETDIESWYVLGRHNFPIFDKFISLVTGAPLASNEYDAVIASYSIYGSNPWLTGALDVIIDFGVVGSILFMVFYGMLSQYLFNKMVRLKYWELIAVNSLLSINALSFAFTSRFRMSALLHAVIIGVIFYIIRRLTIKKVRGLTGE